MEKRRASWATDPARNGRLATQTPEFDYFVRLRPPPTCLATMAQTRLLGACRRIWSGARLPAHFWERFSAAWRCSAPPVHGCVAPDGGCGCDCDLIQLPC